MKRVKGRVTAIVGAAFVAALLVGVPSAQAAVTASSITKPHDLTYLVAQYNYPEYPFRIAGTTNGTTGDHADLVCYAGDGTNTVASNVPIKADGSFNVRLAPVAAALTHRVCNLRAVPSGTTPGDLAPFTGPRLLVGYHEYDYNPHTWLVNFYDYFPGLAGGADHHSLGGCGIADGYLLDPSDSLASVTWSCNATLLDGDANAATRSEVRVDGANAYTVKGAYDINPSNKPFPRISFSNGYEVNPRTGDWVINYAEPIVKCANTTYPPTPGTCPEFVSTGVGDVRTILQTDNGRVVYITDRFHSTDGKPHTLDLLWDNSQQFWHGTGDSTQLEYEFPGENGYSMHALDDVVNLPNTPGVIHVRTHGAADGDTATGQGAIVYSGPAAAATFTRVDPDGETFTLHQTVAVPAHGTAFLGWGYVEGFFAANVASRVQRAKVAVKGCTVPKLKGTTLAAAKKAITQAHCVAYVFYLHSTKVAKGDVIFQKPKPGSHVAYHAPVSLGVSAGPRR